MSQKIVLVPDIGEVLVSKRRGARNIRLSISATGQVRVSIPTWAPYITGVEFAKAKLNWIEKHLDTHQIKPLSPGVKIGKAHQVHFISSPNKTVATRVTPTGIFITTALPYLNPVVQQKALAASERALSLQAKNLLPQKLESLARRHEFEYKSVKIKKLTARWGSCSNHKTITLSYFLMQLPWELIDYVLLHELTHTRHMNHSPEFWDEFTRILPNAKTLRKEMRAHKSRLEPK